MQLNDVDLLRAFVEQVATLKAEGDSLADGLGEYVMENDDAWETVNGLIHEARELLDRQNTTPRRYTPFLVEAGTVLS